MNQELLEVVSLKSLLVTSKYGGLWLDERTHWKRPDIVALKLLVESDTDPDHAAEVVGRSPNSLAWRAHETGLKLSRTWSKVIRPWQWQRIPKVKKIIVPLSPLTQYPFIKEVRGEHEQLLAVNALIPAGLPSHMRADICQEILLAIWEKKVFLEDLMGDKKLVNRFIGKFRRENMEGGGYALSLDIPMRSGKSWYDTI